MFEGNMVALITPMSDNHFIDIKSCRTLVNRQIDSGTKAIIVHGTTGESATLTTEEKAHLLKIVIAEARGRVPIIAGTGTNNTIQTIEITERAFNLGANACLLVTPYYNRPTQHGLISHYEAIANTVASPLILYNVPKRTGVDLLPETVGKLSTHKNIMGIKEAVPGLQRLNDLKKYCEPSFSLYSGDDSSSLEFLKYGGQGMISVLANIAPVQLTNLWEAIINKDFLAAQEINLQLSVLNEALACESNPIPVKWALYRMGLIANSIRLPLTVLKGNNQLLMEQTLMKLNFLT